MKNLVTYFSASGVTKTLAERIAIITESDLFEIKPVQPYTHADLDWHDDQSRSSLEMQDKSTRPAVLEKVKTMDEYDVIYVGFPIWWYIAPTIINTFLESYDFSEKTIIPFATSGMSGVGETDRYLRASCSPTVNYKPAVRFDVNASDAKLKEWIENLNN